MNDYQNLPTESKNIVQEGTWNAWTEEQKAYILSQINMPFVETESGASSLRHVGQYVGKTWHMMKADHERCRKCSFDYLLVAIPKNWSISDADVWNLTKCANVECQNLDEWCW